MFFGLEELFRNVTRIVAYSIAFMRILLFVCLASVDACIAGFDYAVQDYSLTWQPNYVQQRSVGAGCKLLGWRCLERRLVRCGVSDEVRAGR